MIKNKIRNLSKQNKGVAGVIVALLMIGLVFSVLAFIQTVYVPQWMEQKEAEHMDEVAKQFSQLKFAVDTLSVSSTKNTAITSPLTLGSKETPFFTSSRSYGEVEINTEDFKIIVTDYAGDQNIFSIGSLKYRSGNSYFVDQQYTYENGAVILGQEKSDVVVLQPNIFIEANQIALDLIELNDLDAKKTITGFGTYPIKTYFSEKTEIDPILGVKTIELYNTHLEAWKNFFNNTLSDSIINYDITYNDGDDYILITFTNDASLPTLSVNKYTIDVKITSGSFK